MDDDALLRRRLERERLARQEAEAIIEQKSRELFTKSQELERLAVAERKARREAETLRDAFEVFTSRLDPDEIIGDLLEFLDLLVPHDSSVVYVLRGDELFPHSGKGRLHTAAGAEGVPAPSFLADVLRASDPIVVLDAAGDPRVRQWGITCAGAACMVVRLSAHDRAGGCLILWTGSASEFDDAAARFVQALANEAAMALENARLFQEVERLSTVDPLTRLHNRRHFDAAADMEFARSERYHLRLSAVMMDLDHFKDVNDAHGHAAGDAVLVEVAAACTRGTRVTDLLARFGGEEFCFLLPETGPEEAVMIAERLRSAIAALRIEGGGRSVSVTASFGVAERLPKGDSLQDLIARSDAALYEAKRAGRNLVVADGQAPPPSAGRP